MQTLKNAGTKIFHDAVKTYGLDWIRFDQNEKKITYKALVVGLKKKKKSRLFNIFPDFFQVWKIAGQTSRLFQEFKTPYEPLMDVCILDVILQHVHPQECHWS